MNYPSNYHFYEEIKEPSICPSTLNFGRHNQRQKRKNARRAHAAGSKKAFR